MRWIRSDLVDTVLGPPDEHSNETLPPIADGKGMFNGGVVGGEPQDHRRPGQQIRGLHQIVTLTPASRPIDRPTLGGRVDSEGHSGRFKIRKFLF